MNLRRLTARTATVGATVALAAGALVASGSGASAVPADVSNVYTCDADALSMTFDSTVRVQGDLLVTKYSAGAPIDPKLLTISVTATVPADVASHLTGLTNANANDLAFPLGNTSVPFPAAGTFQTNGGATTWNAIAQNGAFTTPDPGTVHALMPQGFTLTIPTPLGDLSVPCELKAGETAKSLGTLKLTQQQSAVSVPAAVKGKKGKATKLAVQVKSTSITKSVVPGNVVVKEGKKVVGKGTLKNGKVTVTLKKLKAGKHKLTVVYTGTKSFKGSHASTVLTVK